MKTLNSYKGVAIFFLIITVTSITCFLNFYPSDTQTAQVNNNKDVVLNA